MTCSDSNVMGWRPCATDSLVFSAPADSSCPAHWNPKHFWCRILNVPKPHTMQNDVCQPKYSCPFPSPLLFHWHSSASHVSKPTGKERVSERALTTQHIYSRMMLFNDILPLGFWTAECSKNLQSIRPMSSPKQLISSVSLTRWKWLCFNGGKMAKSNYNIGAYGCSSPTLVQCGPSSSWLGRNPSSRVYDQEQSTQTCSTKGSAGFSKLRCWKSLGFRNILE